MGIKHHCRKHILFLLNSNMEGDGLQAVILVSGCDRQRLPEFISGIFICLLNTGPCQDIMELVKQDTLPSLCQSLRIAMSGNKL